jgi:hypothetical protein
MCKIKLDEITRERILKICDKIFPNDNFLWEYDNLISPKTFKSMHWYEFILNVLIPKFYSKSIKDFGNGHLRHRQLKFLTDEIQNIESMYYELYNKNK